MTVRIHWLPDNVTVEAEVGEGLLKVADRAGITIPTGCLMGSCHACEVEMNGEDVCSCIASVPPGQSEVTINLFSDPSW